jgi:2-C-methyl-D-erythritol 4-phosphate cytidylyltransferase
MAAGDRSIVAAILVAAGSGSRLGGNVPKAFVEVGGRSLLAHAVSGFVAHPRIRDVVVAAPAQLVNAAAACAPEARVVAGGRTRQESVACALAALAADVDVVLVHDAARALVPVELIDRVLDGLRAPDVAGVVPALPVTDTIRRADPQTGELGEVVDRSQLLAMQTPQGFIRSVLVRAHAAATGSDATDDAALVQAAGGTIVSVAGDQRAFKITVPLDLELAETLLTRGRTDGERA